MDPNDQNQTNDDQQVPADEGSQAPVVEEPAADVPMDGGDAGEAPVDGGADEGAASEGEIAPPPPAVGGDESGSEAPAEEPVADGGDNQAA